jgi:hypothetical protein
MKNDAVEESIVDVRQEILGGNGGFFLEQLDFEVAERGFKH